MPWNPDDAPRHTHKADTPHLCRLWSAVANSVLDETKDDGLAVRAANAAVLRQWRHQDSDTPTSREIGLEREQ
jgi:hypothetical protein